MPVTATVLFDTPQHELASLIRSKLVASTHTQIVTGFATVEGVTALEEPIANNPEALKILVVGAGTYRAYEAFERLVAIGVPRDRLFVHLGHTQFTQTRSARHRFYRYHPMLHSKVYYMEHADGTASAFIGSHNITGFALMGLNGEASVLLEGDKNSDEFKKIHKHIAVAKSEALPYSPSMKEAFSWWTHQFIEGLANKVNDMPRDGEREKTIVILCEAQDNRLPQEGDLLYFELPSALGRVQALRAEVHLFVLDRLPSSPIEGLQTLDQAHASFWCSVVGLEIQRGGVELLADWQIDNNHHPILKRTAQPFRPRPAREMQQVRVKIHREVWGKFEYLFGTPANGWIPEVDQARQTQVPPEYREKIATLELVPAEHEPWFLVTGLISAERNREDSYSRALKQMSPEVGSYVLMSLRRRKRTE